ncbi:Chlamydia 15 kDa cysteine-rich outer membrane protein (CRPA) [Moritella viscosa]|uniref:Chlamydia 15 kDa cysteine-rich outer membrane protein (CRPA) n=1 Tax=Moritella viscosa TaxID=80854 RepID=A0ABY1HLH1_9GAMM|nr:Chlamydia 15 kDa cysteine-rich outer membrane protein (CRPA) [Moritella viscosa]SGZ02576.1 Chlamydia 15 kDa cysteine-rich outer membrane protein (CRPA) [Moritella viscosa]SHO25280.1 Chlamydia 15 kDa cysteine-rich outer membrane protein (CRPA) [Moritella viscosa]
MIGTSESKNAGIAKNNIGTPALAYAMLGTVKVNKTSVIFVDLCTISSWCLYNWILDLPN